MNTNSNNINTKNTINDGRNQSSYVDSIFKNFQTQKISEIPDYFTSNLDGRMIDDFREFIQTNY